MLNKHESKVIVQLSLSEMEQDLALKSRVLPTPCNTTPYPLIDWVLEIYKKVASGREDDVRVIASELISNAILHGNYYDPLKFLQISCLCKGRYFYLAVTDEGLGFDIDNPPFVFGKSGMPPEGGVGIGIIKQRADLVYAIGSTVYCVVNVGRSSL